MLYIPVANMVPIPLLRREILLQLPVLNSRLASTRRPQKSKYFEVPIHAQASRMYFKELGHKTELRYFNKKRTVVGLNKILCRLLIS
jgi:hypothetical protein